MFHADSTIKTRINLVPRENFFDVDGFVADPFEYANFLQLFNISLKTKKLCVSSNYSLIGAHPCEGNETFSAKKGKFVSTPQILYNYMEKVSEWSFSEHLQNNDVFTFFTKSHDRRTKYLKGIISDVAEVCSLTNSSIKWVLFNVDQSKVSFQKDLQLRAPALWYFPKGSVLKGTQYLNKPSQIDILKWVKQFNFGYYDSNLLFNIFSNFTGENL